MTRAVVFDLWDTVAAWPHGDPTHAELVAACGLTLAGWAAADQRDRRWTGSFQRNLDSLGLDDAAAARAHELRVEMTRRVLFPSTPSPSSSPSSNAAQTAPAHL